jgi:uncharacterized coiled-coil protein SlyX
MKRITQLENDMNRVASELAVNSEKLEAANKKNSEVRANIDMIQISRLHLINSYFQNVKKVETIVGELQKKVQEREENMDKTEERLTLVQQKLKEATLTGDESER